MRQFIIKCIESVYASTAAHRLDRVIVVDNASADGSVEAVSARFPSVTIISNPTNIGFGSANNIALGQVTSPYVLILNPDTILEEDTLATCIDEMESNPKIGMVGVKMIDGSGRYLPESKRGLPTIFNAFSKFVGLNRMFPGSAVFNSYYLGHLDDNKRNDVDVLTGAFMFCRTEVIRKVGFFDPIFFMYGEDIDLSKKVLDLGFINVYLPSTRIIHFKGESTKKISLNYSVNFYSAMLKYYKKHHSGISTFFLTIMVYLLGIFSFISHTIKSLIPVAVHGLLIGAGFYGAQYIWAGWYYNDFTYFAHSIVITLTLLYILVVLASSWFFGVFDQNRKFKNDAIAYLFSLFMILLIYALLPEQIRFSRVTIFLGLGMSLLFIQVEMRFRQWFFSANRGRRTVLVASKVNAEVLLQNLRNQLYEGEIIGVVSIEAVSDPYYINDVSRLDEVVHQLNINEIIFSSSDLPSKVMFDLMTYPEHTVKYKIAHHQNDVILGSHSKTRRGEIYEVHSSYNLAKPVYRRLKRCTDIIISIFLLIGLPLFKQKSERINLKGIADVFLGRKTWVGYTLSHPNPLPNLKYGIFDTSWLDWTDIGHHFIDFQDSDKYYSRFYTPFLDFKIIMAIFKNK